MSATEAVGAESWRPGPLLPLRDGRDGALAFVVAVLCACACLTVISALAADRAASGWRRELRASATVQVRPNAGETSGEAAARAAEALAGVRGVAEARALERSQAEALLKPWLGDGALPDDLPIPQLVTVDLDPVHPAAPEALNAALRQADVDASLDDHSRWRAQIERGAALARGVALGAGALMAAAAAAAIAFATRAGLQARREVVEVLHLAGAEDRFVADLFQRRFAWLAAASGAGGALLAAGLAAAVRLMGGEGGFSPTLPLAWTDLLAVLPCPLLAAAVGALAARGAALRALRSRP